jgi:hypothetical protein
VIAVRFTIAVVHNADDERDIDPEVQRLFADEIERGKAMARARRRKRRPILYRIDAIGRDDLAALDEEAV